MKTHREFRTHKLNQEGIKNANAIKDIFSDTLDSISHVAFVKDHDSRCAAIVKTKLEEACFYAKKAMASSQEMNEGEL